MKGKFVNKAVLTVLCCLLAAGCAGGAGRKPVEEAQSTLKVLYFNESAFYQQYGDLFSMENKNVELEVVSTQGLNNNLEDKTYEEAFNELVEKEKPDVLLLDPGTFAEYINDGKLLELDPLLKKDQYSVEGIYPGLLDMLKELGGSKLYGLAPTFYGNAVFYNRELFRKYGVEPPHDQMTWQEILDLARRFPADGDEESRVYGFGNDYSASVDYLINKIASSEDLMYVNPATMKVTVDTDSWKRVYDLAIQASSAGVVYSPKDGGFMGGTIEQFYRSQPFLMGRAAMMVGDPFTLQMLKQAKTAIKDYKPFELGMVSGPVDPADPSTTRNAGINEIFAIHAQSANQDIAWEFLKFVNGEDYARVKSRSMNGDLMSRMGFMKDDNGQSLDVFYALTPKLNRNDMNSRKVPTEFRGQFQSLMSEEIALVQENKKSLDEALKTIQEKGQAALDQALKVQKDNKGNQGGDANEVFIMPRPAN
ncbi:extracellular solute-binding protein [Paenibacillus sp. MSJ-34]|uniref:extracellular solute-binding protein n=1 Tax=Paenibacillus sp. MSJ-34 TaxID=2841529 RepID=UPI001C112392|nr:extracellular solute-binding protein [Paenibacillus sp. MSJ-34]MBU5441638.1 extracellular solute-binding protein [Paenibacillus sp. MSJ-34]